MGSQQRGKSKTPADPQNYRWRIGRKVGRTIYAQLQDHRDSDRDPLIGVMDTPELAAEAVRAHNHDHDVRAAR